MYHLQVSKPITEIFLRVKGELRQLDRALLNLDKDDIFKYRVNLNELLTDLRISLQNTDPNSIINRLISTAASEVILLCEATLCNASRYLSSRLRHQ